MTGMNNVAAIVEGCASILLSGAAAALVRGVRRHSRDHDDTHEALNRLDKRLDHIEDEFWPNGGTSNRDLLEDLMGAVRRIAGEQGVSLPPRRSRPKARRHQ